MPCCFPPNDTNINLATKKKKPLTFFYFRVNWSLFIKSSLFFSLTWTIFQHIFLCTMKLFLLQFLITLFCQTLFHLNLSAVFDITDLSLTLVSVSFCDTFLDHLLLLTSDLSVPSSKKKPQCGGTTNCVLDYCLLFPSLQVILSSDANWFYSSSAVTNHSSTLAKPVFSCTNQNTVSSLIHSWKYLVVSSDSIWLK